MTKGIGLRWIFIPLLIMLANGWFSRGLTGLNEAAIFFLLLPGGGMAAWALFSASRKIKFLPRFFLIAGSLLTALYVLENTVIALLPHLESSFVKDRALIQHLDIANEFLRGILAMGVAGALSLYSQTSERAEAVFHYFRWHSRLAFWIATCAVILVVVLGWFPVQRLDNAATKAHKYRTDKNVELMANKWLFFVDTIQRDVRGIAYSSSAIQAVATAGMHRQRAAADLEDYRMKHPVDVCYLLDAQGKVVVSSVLASSKAILGKDFSTHPHVEHSLSGGEGGDVVFDPATGKSSYFASHPIYSETGTIIGVAVIKENIDRYTLNFNTQPDLTFLVSFDGTIFFSSHAKMVGMNLWPPNKDVEAELGFSRQFGANQPKALLRREVRQDENTFFEGRRYLTTRRFLMEPTNWSIVLLSTNREVGPYRVLGIVVVILFFSLIISFFIVLEKSLASSAQIAVTENRFRALFESAPGAIFITEPDTRKILSTNNFTADWLGYSSEELLLLTLDDLRVPGKEKAPYRYRKRNGTLVYVEEVQSEISFYGSTAHLVIAHDIDDREKTEELLKALSMSDGLTGIANRRHFDEFLDHGWRRAIRAGTEITLIMCDIDFFKNYNDTYGHQAGDDCLRHVAHTIRDNFHRSDDLTARYGGEEFAVILPGTDAEDAFPLAEAVRTSVEALGIPHEASAASSVVTLSLGVATLKAHLGSSPESLLNAADGALYRAKQEGRNRVVAAASS